MVNGHVPVGTKRCVPRLSPLLVPRPRLERLLDDDVRRQVTLVCGPPGAGKTTLLVAALDPMAAARPVAWLSLDERDNDAGRLASLLCAALADGGRDVHRDGEGHGHMPGSGADATELLDDVFGRLARRGERQILVVDDVHELRAPAALATMAHLVAHAPRLLDVVLASRADPPIGLERLHLDGRLGEIRHADLAFSIPETAALLEAHDVHLGNEDVRALWARTEGWAAGLRLAASALQDERDPRRFVRSASQTETMVSDYLMRELLVRKDDAVQWFLLRTSVADRLTPELAELLSDDPRSAEHLEDLERSGVLVAQTDGTHRFHALFGTLLQARLQRHDADLARELHGRAARWYLGHEMPSEARSHAEAAADWDLLGRLMAWRWIDATMDGQTVDGATSTAGLPPNAVVQSPGLALVAAADACRRADREEADLYREAIDARLGDVADPHGLDGHGLNDLADHGPNGLDPGTLHVLGDGADDHADGVDVEDPASWQSERLVLDVDYGCAFGADLRALAASAALGQVPAGDPAAVGLRRLAALRHAELTLDAGDLDLAACLLADLADRGDSCWVGVEAAGYLALLEAARGRLTLADPRIDAVQADRRGCATDRATGAAHLADVLRLVLRGEHRGALVTAVAAAPTSQLGSRALQMIDRVTRAGLSATPSLSVALDRATVEHALAERALIALGLVEVVTPDGSPHVVGGPGEHAIAEARHRLAAGDAAVADDAIARWLETDTRTAHPRTLVEAQAVAAIASAARGDHAGARRHLIETLALTDANGIVAPLLQHGVLVALLLERNMSEMGPHMGAALDLLERIRPTGAGDLLEPLTDREMEVLVHLPTLMSNAEIATGLHLSVNTVKTHLKAVYRKLGVDGRRQAVVRGRELELIS
jgi:LuxR family transcriptional regulator, maltose regulon positive regulatory protein